VKVRKQLDRRFEVLSVQSLVLKQSDKRIRAPEAKSEQHITTSIPTSKKEEDYANFSKSTFPLDEREAR